MKEKKLFIEYINLLQNAFHIPQDYGIKSPIVGFKLLLGRYSQGSGTQISERIWQDSNADLLVEARLADWKEDANSQVKKVVTHSGKNITWSSFRHTYITMRLSASVPLPTVAANTEMSMKYI